MVNKKRLLTAVGLAALISLLFSGSLMAQFGEQPRPRIDLVLEASSQALLVQLEVPADHHITDVKNGFFSVSLAEHPVFALGEIQYPPAVAFGEEQVYKGSVTLRVPLLMKGEWTPPQELKLTVSWQMCQETPVEMCFAPDEQSMAFVVKEAFRSDSVAPTTGDTTGEGFVDRMIKRFQRQLEGRSFWALLTVFLLGFLTSLTPCVYPVIPVIMGFVGARSQGKKGKAFSLSLFFVLGLAIVYSILGVVAAQTGSVIGASFQNPLFVVIISLVFVVMGLSLAGLFDIPVPNFIAARAQSGAQRNQWVGALIVGAVSGFIAAPCAGPVVIALVTFISQTSDVWLGFSLMFAFALGMGIIFLLVGTFSGLVGALPQGGGWMEKIKIFFALLLIGAGLYFVGVVSPVWVSTLLWGVFLMGFALLAGAFDPMPDEMPKRFGRLLLLLILLFGAFLFFEGLALWRHGAPTQSPAVAETEGLPWVKSVDQALARARSEGKTVMLDAYADWCSACKELDHKTFSDQTVRQRLDQMVLLKLDLTANNDETKALRQRFSILAMPTVIFLDGEGRESGRFTGFKTSKEFLTFVEKLAMTR